MVGFLTDFIIAEKTSVLAFRSTSFHYGEFNLRKVDLRRYKTGGIVLSA